MKAKTTTPQKQQPRRRSKDEIEILEHAAGAYYLLLNAIMQNKKLSADVMMRWIEANGFVLMRKEEVSAAEIARHPEMKAMLEKANAQLAAAREEIEKWENELMDLVR